MPFPDYEEFIASLNENRVKYLIIGAQALAYHARPRATKDLDLFVDASSENAARLLAALKDFFNADTGYTVEDLTSLGTIIQLGVAPVRIDLMNQISGISAFDDVWSGRIEGRFGGSRAWFISLDDLIRTKQAANRLQDRADVRVLKRIREKAKKPSRKK
jgi:predicted nucleotidyltransferase